LPSNLLQQPELCLLTDWLCRSSRGCLTDLTTGFVTAKAAFRAFRLAAHVWRLKHAWSLAQWNLSFACALSRPCTDSLSTPTYWTCRRRYPCRLCVGMAVYITQVADPQYW